MKDNPVVYVVIDYGEDLIENIVAGVFIQKSDAEAYVKAQEPYRCCEIVERQTK